MSNRLETCRIYGHYWDRRHYSFVSHNFELLPHGELHCGWCHSYSGRVADPGYFWCMFKVLFG